MKFVCVCCGEEHQIESGVKCNVCSQLVCPDCYDIDAEMCYNCKNDLAPCECEICKCLLDDDDFVSCDTCGHGVCHNCSPDDIHCKECYDEMEEDEDAQTNFKRNFICG